MNAARIARILKAHGLPVINVQEGDHDMDGMVEVTPLVHVQVPTYERWLAVVSQSADGQEFTTHRERKPTDIAGIVADIRKACGFAA